MDQAVMNDTLRARDADSAVVDACHAFCAVQSAYDLLNDADPRGPNAEQAHGAALSALCDLAHDLAERVCTPRATSWAAHQARAQLLRKWQDHDAGWMAERTAPDILAALVRDMDQAS